jgi:arginyl-tRNA synthetase
MRDEIKAVIQKSLRSIGAADVEFTLERPGEFSHGDYATNAALVAAKILKKNPKEIAESLKKESEGKIVGVSKVEVAGAGFLNFFLSHETVAEEIKKAATDDSWGENDLYADKKVMVEYTDPNPFKEFHIGHLMSNTIGESIARLFESAGAEVSRANYQGDVGVHVAKAIWGKQQKPEYSWGEAYVYGSEQYELHKEEIDVLNKTIYEKTDSRVNALYDVGRAESLEHFEELYKLLGTKFDFYFFESEVGQIGLGIVKKHPDIFEESEGAIVFKGENHGLHTRVFINSKGLPTYEAKELGLVEAKKEKGDFDISLTVTANEIREYFKVVRKAAELVFPDLEGKMLARFHGFLKLTTGKMSSRKGNVITGESLLLDLQKDAREKVGGRELQHAQKVAEQVAVGAIKYAVLKQGSGRDIIFDPEKSLSLEGDSGPYLQYARVRALSVLRKVTPTSVVDTLPQKDQWMNLARVLVHYPEVVERAAQELEPHYVTTYLTELAAAFNSLYGAEQFIVEGKILGMYLTLLQAFERTMVSGLHILGIPAPEEM